MAAAACKFTVHFLTSFSTTETSFRNNGSLLSGRPDAGPTELPLGMDVVAITTVAMFAAGMAMFVV